MIEYDTPTEMHDQEIRGRIAWTRSDIGESDWCLPMSAAVLGEIDDLIETLRRNPVDTIALCLEDYPLPACRALMRQVRAVLDVGVGFAVLDRLDVDRYGKDALKQVYWLLSSMISRPVAQAFDGRLLYDVRDTGEKTSVRVRGDLTNQELSWHSDYGFNFGPPYLGLLVLRTSKEGGISSAASLMTAHNVLRKRDERLLRRLYQPFYWNRQGEHPEGEPVTHHHPMFQFDGQSVRGRYNRSLIPVGYQLVGQELDQTGRDAIDALSAVMSEQANHVTFSVEPGQMQFVNNFKMAHSRTDYVDHDEPDRKRHLIRIFLRDFGRRSYMG